ncbi:hypothetical protein CY34DRAFT_813156 [Suillus luteus UH-Slu-Lm8-n1]|uniref:Uncharacterized protein n=1 Tax=Suillus luteus UH-Slu-Lm8-n1 TaxID=930992 RepID=A0A0D0A7E7_9AGAM|nr:hypothetical protein CY34DRAFT_813156 [Suillus luteus UH-Slu-Lm8-n1]
MKYGFPHPNQTRRVTFYCTFDSKNERPTKLERQPDIEVLTATIPRSYSDNARWKCRQAVQGPDNGCRYLIAC